MQNAGAPGGPLFCFAFVMTRPYTHIPDIYDYLLRHVDYERWYRYLRSLLFRYVDDPRTILEIGCGTGKFGSKFSRDDFLVYGMDNSIEMLRVAKPRARRNFRAFCGDARCFALARKMDFIFSVHDTLNYLIEMEDLVSALASARGAMHDGSVFMFDLTTEYNIRRFFDGKVTRHVRSGVEVVWENSYDPSARIVFSRLSVKRKDGSVHEEEHLQRIYTKEEALEAVAGAGLTLVDIFGDYTFDPPHDETVMVNYVTRKGQ